MRPATWPHGRHPNHMNTRRDYDNRLVITGKHEDVNKFYKSVTTRGTRISLEKLVPANSYYDDKFHPNQRRKLWGTLSDVYTRCPSQPENGDGTDSLIYCFTSENGAPTKWVKNVSPMFPSLRMELTYEAEDNYWAPKGTTYEGYLSVTNGKTTKDYYRKRAVEPEPDDADDDEIEDDNKQWYDVVKERALFKSEDDF